MVSRRQFLKAIAAIGGVLLIPLDRLVQPFGLSASAQTVDSEGGELYEGFLLLSESAPPPLSVQTPALGIPTFCGVGGSEPTAVIEHFSSLADLASRVTFPLYTFSKLPEGYSIVNVQLISHATGEPYAASLAFEPSREELGPSNRSLSLWVEPEFPRPYPIWDNSGEWDANPRPQLATTLPAPGLMKTTLGTHIFYWIKYDTLYTLHIGLDIPQQQAVDFAKLLVPFKS